MRDGRIATTSPIGTALYAAAEEFVQRDHHVTDRVEAPGHALVGAVAALMLVRAHGQPFDRQRAVRIVEGPVYQQTANSFLTCTNRELLAVARVGCWSAWWRAVDPQPF